jgi:8-oxo-dGTP pyrophosphatase MutT (NUDIX family)
METRCDNTSVGIILENKIGEILLLNRAKFPFGLAAPAGHIDNHGSPEQAMIDEVSEEVGLYIASKSLEKVIDARRIDNKCRRAEGDHHYWTVFRASNVEGEFEPSADETLGVEWVSLDRLNELSKSTIDREDTPASRGDQVLEPIWLSFFTELGYTRNLNTFPTSPSSQFFDKNTYRCYNI